MSRDRGAPGAAPASSPLSLSHTLHLAWFTGRQSDSLHCSCSLDDSPSPTASPRVKQPLSRRPFARLGRRVPRSRRHVDAGCALSPHRTRPTRPGPSTPPRRARPLARPALLVPPLTRLRLERASLVQAPHPVAFRAFRARQGRGHTWRDPLALWRGGAGRRRASTAVVVVGGAPSRRRAVAHRAAAGVARPRGDPRGSTGGE